MKSLINIIVLISIFLIFSCSDKVVKQAFISPPFADLNPQYTEYEINADYGDTVFIDSGSEIIIPADIWVNKNGEKVKGKINLKYREFSDALDIFLAGVPMCYDSANVKSTLKTAGMFELRAFKDTNEIFINKGKFIDVKFASNVKGGEYNFYTFDEQAENWEYKGTDKPTENYKISLMKDSIEKFSPKHPVPFTKDYFALDYYAILDVYFNVKPGGNLYPYYNNKSLERKSETYGLKWSGIYGTWNKLSFNGKSYFAYELVWKNVSDKKMPKWMMTKQYQTENRLIKLKHMGNNKYFMHVVDNQYNTKNEFKFFAEAIQPLKEVFKLMPDDWKNEYDIAMIKIAETQKRIELQKKFLRTFQISQTGWHNWDLIDKRNDRILVKANFKFDKEVDNEMITLLYFTDSNKTYVKIPYTDWDKIRLVPDESAKFLAVLSDKEAAVYTAKEYSAINFQELSSIKEPSYTFNMKSRKINNRNDFLKIMEN
ncbi:MAG: hypothetical protein JXR51_00630 [Bacteroidales bacterium]|nr:hypothetical protein [Bacteroidales bacterium]